VISWSSGDDRIGVAFAEHGDMIAGEVLAVEVTESADSGGETIEVNGTEVRIAILKSN
jgi:hypothetical protein